MAAPPPLPATSALLSSVPRIDSTFDQSGVRGRACAPDCSWARAVGSSRCALTASGSEKAGIFTGRSPERASATWVSLEPYHFMNAIALSLFGADAETPWMKMPIWASALTCLGTTPKSSLPTSLDADGSSDLMAFPEYWMIAAASPPRIAAPSWSESNSATPGGAIDFSVPTKKSAAALPSAELKVGFHLSSNMVAPNDRNTG